MTAKNRSKAKPKSEPALTDDGVDAWEAENWDEIQAKLAEAEAAVAAGRVREVTVEQLMKDALRWKQKRPKS